MSYGKTRPTYRERILEPIITAKSKIFGWEKYLPKKLPSYSTINYNPQYSADEYFANAREKLLWVINRDMFYFAIYTIIYGSVAYDWLVNENYSNNSPVLSEKDKTQIQQALIANADYLKARVGKKGQLFKSGDIAAYMYPIVGMALYERSREGDPAYVSINMKAKEYLNDFDTYWVGKILPALNEQGGDGGWHGGMTQMKIPWRIKINDDKDYNIPEIVSILLFSHYTATDMPIEKSLFSTGIPFAIASAVTKENASLNDGTIIKSLSFKYSSTLSTCSV